MEEETKKDRIKDYIEDTYMSKEERMEELRKARYYRNLWKQYRPVLWGVLACLILILLIIEVLPATYILFFLVFLVATVLEIIIDGFSRHPS